MSVSLSLCLAVPLGGYGCSSLYLQRDSNDFELLLLLHTHEPPRDVRDSVRDRCDL